MTHFHRRNPHIYLGGRIHRKPLMGCGMGSVLMSNGGAGGGSSYPSVEEYHHTTGRGLDTAHHAHLGEKLDKLMVKPLQRKPQNIKFSI